MLFESIPRGSMPAALTAADLISRIGAARTASPELRHAVAVANCYLTNPDSRYTAAEFRAAMVLVEQLYSSGS